MGLNFYGYDGLQPKTTPQNISAGRVLGKLTVGSCDGKTLVSWIGVPRLSFPLRR